MKWAAVFSVKVIEIGHLRISLVTKWYCYLGRTCVLVCRLSFTSVHYRMTLTRGDKRNVSEEHSTSIQQTWLKAQPLDRLH